METKRSFSYWMRVLHRDIGFLAIGLSLVFAISGVTLVFRNTDFLKTEQTQVRNLPAALSADQLSQELRMRNFTVESEDDQTIHFNQGSYNKVTGEASLKVEDVVFPINLMNRFHKISGNDTVYIISVLFAIILVFLAVSSLFIFPKGRLLKRAIILTLIGLVIAIVSVMIL